MSRTPELIDLLERWDEEDEAGVAETTASLRAGRPVLLAELEQVRAFRSRLERIMGSLDGLNTMVPVGKETRRPPSWPTVPGYEITGELGEGGMGRVYKATCLRLKREVALKVIAPDCVTGETLLRFSREAEAIAHLDHPSIVKIFEIGEYTPAGGAEKMPFLALEFVPAGTLEARAGTTPMPPCEAARVVRLLARAVAHAHERGVVHRDLKPANVMIGRPSDEPALNAALGCPKITDFGLARRVEPDPTVTGPRRIVGTPNYMAPEQARCEFVGPLADVYSLGAILYRLLTGSVVFPAAAWVDALIHVCNTPPRPLRQVVGDIPPGLEALCLECLSKNAEVRPTAAALAARLVPFTVPDLEPAEEAPRARPSPTRSRRRLLIAVSLVACLMLPAALLAWRLTRQASPVAQIPVAVEPLKGYLDAWMTRKGSARQQGIHLSDVAARPLRPGDEIRVEAKLNRPAYVYLVWVDTAGEVTPMYPWIDGDWNRRGPEDKAETFRLPQLGGKWAYWPMGPGKPGLETMVLLGRDQPLPAEVDLKGMIGTFGPQLFKGQDLHAIAWFANGEAARDEELRAPLTQPVEGSNALKRVNREVQRRAKGYFEFTRAITYGNEGGE